MPSCNEEVKTILSMSKCAASRVCSRRAFSSMSRGVRSSEYDVAAICVLRFRPPCYRNGALDTCQGYYADSVTLDRLDQVLSLISGIADSGTYPVERNGV